MTKPTLTLIKKFISTETKIEENDIMTLLVRKPPVVKARNFMWKLACDLRTDLSRNKIAQVYGVKSSAASFNRAFEIIKNDSDLTDEYESLKVKFLTTLT